MTLKHTVTAGLCGLLLIACLGCSSPVSPASSTQKSEPNGLSAPADGLSRVLFVGDSIADGLAVPLSFAMDANGVEFSSMTVAGGGTVVGELGQSTWATLEKRIAGAKPSTIIYQITTYDWGTAAELEAAYQRLESAARQAGADLVIVTMPPIRADDFYRPHMAELALTTPAAQRVADGSAGRAHLVDAGAVWGSTYAAERDGKLFRSSDGIHACPHGAARFTTWLLDELAGIYPGFAPGSPAKWANSGWSADKRFVGC